MLRTLRTQIDKPPGTHAPFLPPYLLNGLLEGIPNILLRVSHSFPMKVWNKRHRMCPLSFTQ